MKKTMTCRQLGGACDVAFHAETFDEMAKISRTHAMEMYARSDEAHMDAMAQMSQLMSDPSAMQEWMDARTAEFDALTS